MADILLTVGVDTSLSFEEFQSGINSLVSQINGNPPKIKVKLDNSSLSSMKKQIESLTKAAANINKTPTDGYTQMKSGIWVKNTADIIDNTDAKKKNADATKKAADANKQFEVGTKKHTDALNKVNTLLSQVTANTNKWTAASTGKSQNSYQTLKSQITALQRLRDGLLDGSVSAKEFNTSYDKIKSTVVQSTAAIKSAGENTQAFGDRIVGLTKKFSTWLGLTRIIMTTVRTCKEMVSTSMDIENSMAQLKIVTGASDAKMESFLTKSTGLAKELGKSITDVSSSIETFSRLGYGLEDASELAKYANILSNVAKVDADTATTGLTSIIKGYGMDVSEAEHVSDVLVKVGQEYAISAEELMTAFQRGGAALYASGTDFEKSAALFAATNASLQSAETVGTMWKTVSARIRGATTELEDMGEETEGLADGLSKYREEIMALSGVDIMKDENTYKDIFDIFVELAQVWDNMRSDEARSRIAEILGGTRQLSGIMSTITNIKDAIGAYESAMDSAGASTQANDIFMNTSIAHLNQLKASFQELSATLVDTGFVTSIIDFGTNLIKILTYAAQAINTIGGLNTVLKATVGIFAILKADQILSLFTSLRHSVYKFGSDITNVFSIFKLHFAEAKASGASSLQALGSSFSYVTTLASKAQLAIGAFVAVLTIATAAYNAYHQKLRQSAQSELQKADSAKENYQAFKNAYIIASQYADKTTLSATENEKLQSAINSVSDALGGQSGQFNTTTGSAADYLNTLKEISKEQLQQNLSEANKGEKAARDLLSDTADPHFGGLSVGGSKTTIQLNDQMTGVESHVKALEYINRLMGEYIDLGTYGSEIEPINFDSLSYGTTEYTDAITDYYFALKNVQNEMANDDLAIESDLYKDITNTINTLSDDTEAYIKSKKDQLVAEYEMQNGIPSTIDEYEKMQNAILESIDCTDAYATAITNLMLEDFQDSIGDLSNEVLQSSEQIKSVSDKYTEASAQITQDTKQATDSVKTMLSGISAVQEALSGQKTGKSISVDDFNSDALIDYRDALEYVNGTMQLNADKVKEIAQAKVDEQVAMNNTNKALEQAKYLENAKQIEEYRQKLIDASFAEGETKESVQDSIDALLAENRAISEKCAQYDLLSHSIQEAIGSYQHWINAQSSSDYGDMANDTVSAIQRIRDTYDKNSEIFGDFGSKKFDAAIDFIIPDTVDGEDLNAIESYMAKFKQYLNFNEDGAVEGLNIDKFLEKSVSAGLMSYSEDDGFKVLGGKKMEDFAEGLNMSSGMVQAFFDELQLKGAEFDWGDEAVKTIGDLAIEANEAAESLRNIEGNSNLSIKMDVSDLDTADEQIAALDTTIAEMESVKVKAGVDTSEVDDANSVIQYCLTQKQLLTQPDVMRVDTSKVESDIGNAISLLQQFQTAQNDLEIKSKVDADTSDAEAKINSLASEIQTLPQDIKTKLSIDSTSIDSIATSIANLDAKSIEVNADVDASAIEGYHPDSQTCDVIYDPKTDLLPESFSDINRTVNYVADTDDLPDSFRTITRYVNYVKSGDISVNGTAHVGGTAKASGDWGTAPGGRTLVGELGREIVVDPYTGKWYTVGDNGAEFRDIPAGAIVFNHVQSEQLLKNGYVSGRASALVSGTALVTGGYKPYQPSSSSTTRPSQSSQKTSKKSSKKSSSDKSSNNSKKDFKETFDFIEIAISRLERSVDKLKQKAENTYKKFSTRNKAAASEISKISKEINVQEKAYTRYIKKANSIGLSKSWKDKVKNGKINISTIKDEKLANKIKEYQEWYEKALECKDAVAELHEEIASLYEDQFNNLVSKYEGDLALIEHKTNSYQNGLDLLVARGYKGSTVLYKALSDAKKEDITILQNELKGLISEYSKAMKSKEIEEGSQAWYEMQQSINSVKEAIQEAEITLAEYTKSMRELDWEYFDFMEERISDITNEAEFLIDLLSNEKLFDDKGNLTDIGTTTMGLYGQNYNVFMAQADQYAEKIKELNDEIANDPYNTDLINRRQELIELQRESILSAEDEKQSILSLVEEGINLQLESLKELINTYNDSLDSAKDLYNYQKKVKDQTEKIASLQKQLSAYAGDTSEETKATIQKIEVDLADAMEDLQETEYDQYISDQKKLLDNLYNEYETILNKRLDNVDALISDMIKYINENASTIETTITEECGNVGYTLTDAMNNIWKADGGAFTVISTYGEKFLSQNTSTLNAILGIKTYTDSLMAKADGVAKETVDNTTSTTPVSKPVTTTTTTTTKKPTSTSTSKKTTSSSKSTQGDGKIQVGDKVKFKSGKYYSSSSGSSPTGSKNLGKQVYVTKINSKGSKPYHISTGKKLGSGDLGWLTKSQLSGYARGLKYAYKSEDVWVNELAPESIISPSQRAIITHIDKSDRILNGDATENIWDMANDPSKFIKDIIVHNNDISKALMSSFIDSPTDIRDGISHIQAPQGVPSSTNIGDIRYEINIPIDHVSDYNDFMNQMRKDGRFEKMIQSMTVDRLAGGSKISKNKYRW